MHCRRFLERPLTRRAMLTRCANGFGALALTTLLGEPAFGALLTPGEPAADPLAPRPPHFPARARNVIFLYMDGGPSQVDTFDPKPRLDREHGQPFKVKIEPTQFNNVGNVLKSPWKFRNYGESGIPVSDLFPHVAGCVDDLAIVRSMTSNFSEHTSANYFLHTGSGLQGRPSMGAWVTYGLGSECQDLPGFVVLNGGLIPPGGLDNFNSGFLPAAYQGSIFKAGDTPVANIRPREPTAALQRASSTCCGRSTRRVLGQVGPNDAARIGHRQLRARLPDADGRARADRSERRDGGDAASSTAWTSATSRRGSSAASACWPGGWSSAACASSS